MVKNWQGEGEISRDLQLKVYEKCGPDLSIIWTYQNVRGIWMISFSSGQAVRKRKFGYVEEIITSHCPWTNKMSYLDPPVNQAEEHQRVRAVSSISALPSSSRLLGQWKEKKQTHTSRRPSQCLPLSSLMSAQWIWIVTKCSYHLQVSDLWENNNICP